MFSGVFWGAESEFVVHCSQKRLQTTSSSSPRPIIVIPSIWILNVTAVTASGGDAVLLRSATYAKYCNRIQYLHSILFRIERGTRSKIRVHVVWSIHKFKDPRKASKSPPVVSKRRSSFNKRQGYGLPGYLPLVGNTGISDQRTINTLKSENITAEEVSDGMNQTFPIRRRQVAKEKIRIKKLKKIYPQLFTIRGVARISLRGDPWPVLGPADLGGAHKFTMLVVTTFLIYVALGLQPNT